MERDYFDSRPLTGLNSLFDWKSVYSANTPLASKISILGMTAR